MPAKISGEINTNNNFISELNIQELEIEKLLSFWQIVLTSDTFGIITINPKGDIVNVNDNFLKLWRISETKLVNKNYAKYQNYLENQIEARHTLSIPTEKDRSSDRENKFDLLKLKDGRIFAQTYLIQKLENKEIGKIWFTWEMGKLANLSREKEETEELNNNQISQLAKKHNSLKGMFFSMLCHQFRSSLNIISFSNSLLKRHFLNTEKKQEQEYLLNNIQAGVEEISKLLDELVFYGKLENQEIEFSPDLIDINLYCEQIVEQTRSSDLNQRRIINFKKNSNNEVVCLDKKLLKPMITNLLTNAIKHSSENSSIDLEISCQKQKTIFQIKDRGIGIEQGDLPKLFEPFFRGSNVGSIKGNGMGLAIVKNLVEIQRGSIDISSVVGIGTTVTVTLPSFSYVSKSIN